MKICHELWAEDDDSAAFCVTEIDSSTHNKTNGIEEVIENGGEERDEDEDAFGTNNNTTAV